MQTGVDMPIQIAGIVLITSYALEKFIELIKHLVPKLNGKVRLEKLETQNDRIISLLTEISNKLNSEVIP